MSKTQQAQEMFRANNQATAKEVAEKVGISVAHAYTIRRAVVGPVYRHKKKRARVQTAGQKTVIQLIKTEANGSDEKDKTIKSLNDSIILIQAQLSDALRRVEEDRAVIRYLERKIEDAASV
jgi:crotonobetainyl-CoA:carnitine CoA-transferase CaiB-like acyl-CoA transferase